MVNGDFLLCVSGRLHQTAITEVFAQPQVTIGIAQYELKYAFGKGVSAHVGGGELAFDELG